MPQISVSPKRTTYPNYLDYIGYAAFHLACFGVIWTGTSWTDIWLCVILYVVRMFGLTAGYHRYFSHKSYKMGRIMQFIMGLLGTLTVQKGVLWWASTHRHHHRYSDTHQDLHSPAYKGFWYAHMGWFLDDKNRFTNYSMVPDLLKYPEIVWLNRHCVEINVLFALSILVLFGWSGLFWGFFISTVLLWHVIHGIGSIGHSIGGYRNYHTTDNSRNNWFLGIVMLGEGWHNNHHYYPSSARQGFRWWEIDVTYSILKILSLVGLVTDLRTPSKAALKGESSHYRKKIRDFQAALTELRMELKDQFDVIQSELRTLQSEQYESFQQFQQRYEEIFDFFMETSDALMLEPWKKAVQAYVNLRDQIIQNVDIHTSTPGVVPVLQLQAFIAERFSAYAKKMELDIKQPGLESRNPQLLTNER